MIGRKSILIVDDELSVREALKMILKPICQIQTAADGKEALEVIRKGKIDLVTLDLKMPGLSGIEVLRKIKESYPDIEVLIVTAYSSAQTSKEANQYGANQVIPKPFSAPELIETVNKTLERQNSNLRMKNFSLYNSLVTRV